MRNDHATDRRQGWDHKPPVGELTTIMPPTVKQRYESWWQRFKVAPNDYRPANYKEAQA